MRTLRLLLALLSAATLAQSQTRAETESKVLALERLWGEAAQLRDIKALDSIFDASIAYVHIDGRLMTKPQVLADTRAVSPVEIVVRSAVAHSFGNVAVVTGVLRLTGFESGKPYRRYGRFLDSWVMRNGQWVCVSSMTTPMSDAAGKAENF